MPTHDQDFTTPNPTTTRRVRTPYGVFVAELAPDGKTIRQTLVPRGQRIAAPTTTPAQPCRGCGGAQYRPQDFNRPGGADDLLQHLD